MNESRIQQTIRLATNLTGGLLFRNNSGVSRELRSGGTMRYVRYGLGNDSERMNTVSKSSDLIGITPIIITPELIGRTLGVFTAIEVKNPDWKYRGTPREVAQRYFLKLIRERGGIAAFAPDELAYFNVIAEFLNNG